MPIFVIQINVVIKNKPGMMMTHHVFRSSALLANESILPQETTSTGSPKPRKLSVDSMDMLVLILDTTTNMIADTKLGTRCFFITCPKLLPIHLAAST